MYIYIQVHTYISISILASRERDLPLPHNNALLDYINGKQYPTLLSHPQLIFFFFCSVLLNNDRGIEQLISFCFVFSLQVSRTSRIPVASILSK